MNRKDWRGRLLGLWKKAARQSNMDARTPRDARARFQLRLGQLLVGVLAVEDGRWTFQYTDEFRQQQEFTPLPIFPDLDTVYRSDELWQFFRMRVPSLKQPSIREIVRREGLDSHDEVQLLKRFGRRTISNPFVLIDEQELPQKPIVLPMPRAVRPTARPIVYKTHGTDTPADA